MTRIYKSLCLTVGWLAAAAAAQTSPVPVPSPAPDAPPISVGASDGYRLGVNDEVQISIYGAQSEVVRSRVADDGTVTVPYLGNIRARDLTVRELATAITAQLRTGGYLVRPIVNVDVLQFVSNTVTVLGNVATPGIYPLDRSMTLTMLVARAGGGRPDAAEYALLRRRDDPVQHRVSFDSIAGEWNGTTRLAPGDTVYVPAQALFFAYGQVNSPGAFPIRSGMTVRQALARAGGPTLAGSQHKVTIYRGDQRLKKVDLDEEVQPNDTLYVNERFF